MLRDKLRVFVSVFRRLKGDSGGERANFHRNAALRLFKYKRLLKQKNTEGEMNLTDTILNLFSRFCLRVFYC